jgi:hypothetical protein
MNLLNKVENKLRELNVSFISVELSDRKDKKLKLIYYDDNENIKTVHFGSKGSETFLDHNDEKKRKAYIARHSKILLKDGTRAIDKKYSSAWFSMNILWN